MDEFRRFRFLIPAFWFVGLILSAACANVDETRKLIQKMDNRFEKALGNDTGEEQKADGKLVIGIIGALAAGGFVVFTAGYLIGSLAITSASLVGQVISLLRWICVRLSRTKWRESSTWSDWFKSDKNFHWETGIISNEDRQELEKAIGYRNGKRKCLSLYVVDAYHHGVLTKGISNLLARRWTLFMIGMNCVAAFVAAFVLLWCERLLPRSASWWIITLVLVSSILWNTVSAWWFVRRMSQLILRCDNIPELKGTTEEGPVVTL